MIKLSGAEFFRSIDGLSGSPREQLILQAFADRQFPDELGRAFWRRIAIEKPLADSKTHRAELKASPDFLGIGSVYRGANASFARVPMMLRTADTIARWFDAHLPTRAVALAIWRAADVRLSMHPIDYRDRITESSRYVRQNTNVEADRAGRLGYIVDGCKKNLVLCSQLQNTGDRDHIAIYGARFFDTSDFPGQGLNPVDHDDIYVDYSHGVRLVHRVVQIDGRDWDYEEALAHPLLSALLSDQGPIESARANPRRPPTSSGGSGGVSTETSSSSTTLSIPDVHLASYTPGSPDAPAARQLADEIRASTWRGALKIVGASALGVLAALASRLVR